MSAPRLLLFDDDAAIVAVVKRYFDGRSWQVDTATDAEAALRELDGAQPFDAMICDLHFTPAQEQFRAGSKQVILLKPNGA